MKRTAIIILTLSIFSALSSFAQVVSYEMITRNSNTNVRLTLKDAKTSDPISWASVYLIPPETRPSPTLPCQTTKETYFLRRFLSVNMNSMPK